MLVENLVLKNFRNYKNIEIQFHPFLNILVGDNAQGKTNILESLYYVSIGKSHRTNKDNELVRWDTSFFFLFLNFYAYNRKCQIEFKLEEENNKKSVKINGVPKRKISELIGNFNAVLFSPEDLNLVKGSPSIRRKFLDLEISQVSPSYYNNLQIYTKILFQRNKLLKNVNNTNKELLDVWDTQLIDIGTKILLKRLEVLKKIIPLARLMHRKITDGLEELEIKYFSSFNLGKQNEIDIKKGFIAKLEENKNVELYRKMSITGPHRDDLGFFVNDINMKNFGSQGQQRTTALSLKLAELEYMKSEKGEYPVLLLDDVMSELDKNRRYFLLKTIQNKIQTFITSTNMNYFDKKILEQAKIFNIENGLIKNWEV